MVSREIGFVWDLSSGWGWNRREKKEVPGCGTMWQRVQRQEVQDLQSQWGAKLAESKTRLSGSATHGSS